MALYNMNLVQRKGKRLSPAMGNSRFQIILTDVPFLCRTKTLASFKQHNIPCFGSEVERNNPGESSFIVYSGTGFDGGRLYSPSAYGIL